MFCWFFLVCIYFCVLMVSFDAVSEKDLQQDRDGVLDFFLVVLKGREQ